MRSRTQSEADLLSVLPSGIFILNLVGMTFLLAYVQGSGLLDGGLQLVARAFVAYLAVLAAAFLLRESARSGLRDLIFWGFGFAALSAFYLFGDLRAFGLPVPVDGSQFPLYERYVDAAALMLLSLFLFIGSVRYGAARPASQTIAACVSFVFVAAIAVLILPGLPALALKESALLLTILHGLSIVLAVSAAGLLAYNRSFGDQSANNWLISAFALTGFASLFHLLSAASGDAYQAAAFTATVVLLSLCAFGFFAQKARRQSQDRGLGAELSLGHETLRLTRRAYKELLNQVSEGIVVCDAGNNTRYCNRAFAEMLGYEPGQVNGLHLSAFLDTDAYEEMLQSLANRQKQEALDFEVVLHGRENRQIPASLHILPVLTDDEMVVGNRLMVTDLSQQRQREKEWRRLTEEKTAHLRSFRECVAFATDGIVITEASGRISYTNRSFEKMAGYDANELTGKQTDVFCLDDASELTHAKIWNSLKAGKAWRGEFRIKKRGGKGFVAELSVTPLETGNRGTGKCLWFIRDISRRKVLEANLRKYAEDLNRKTDELESSKAYYDSLISGMSDILLVVDNAGHCTFLNDYGQRRLGYEATDLGRTRLPVFFDDLNRLESDYGESIQVEIKDFECHIKPREGEPILCSWYARPLFDRFGRRTGAMAVGRDVTEYKRMQNELEDYAKNLERNVEERTLELEKKLTQLGKLLEIGEEIRLNGDVDVIINKICEAVQALGWRRVVISLRDYEKEVSQPVATVGLPPEQIEEVMSWRDIPFEHTDKYFKEHFRISHSYFIPHEEEYVSTDVPYSVYSDLGASEEGEWNSMDALLVPIRTKDKILGTISVDEPVNKKRPGFDEVRDLEIFADKAAIAIENVRLFQVQKENEREAKFLADISKIFHASLNLREVLDAVVEKGGRTIGEFCSLLLTENETQKLLPEASFHNNPRMVDLFVKGTEEFPCQANEGIVGGVVSTGKACMMNAPFAEGDDAFSGTLFHHLAALQPISSLMVVPLQAPGKIIGAMVYMSFEGKRRYRPEELRLSLELASRAALAIENARLFEEAGQKALELEKANKMKSQFLANVSHELRTPLNAIITLSDLMMRGLVDLNDEEQHRQLEIIHRSGRNLLNLINDILDLSKIEAGRVEPTYTAVPIASVVLETIEHIRPLCIQKHLTLEHRFDKNLPDEIYSDQDKLTKAITNILGNAVKFTRRGGITVSMRMREKKLLEIAVADTGIGIPSDRLDEIFQEFHQIDSTDSRNYGGTGLGLAITKRVLNLIDGRVDVESQLGKGSKFTITLPLKSRKEIRAGRDLEQRLRRGDAEQEESPLFEVKDERDNLSSRKKTILVIDDEVESRYVMARYLQEKNYQMIFAENDEDAIELARQYHPFAITLDIIMPHKSGWEILKCLKDDAETREFPVIVSTILRERERALELGASAYLRKPITQEALCATLDRLAERQAQHAPRFEIPKLWGLRRKQRKSVASGGDGSATARNRILLVDDDKDTRYALRLILEGAGYKVHFANEGREALDMAETVDPHLILMDIMMPGMDGYEAARALKAQKKFHKVPIVAMTAKAMKGDREKTILAGCDDYIAKPFVTDDILAMIRKWLAESESA